MFGEEVEIERRVTLGKGLVKGRGGRGVVALGLSAGEIREKKVGGFRIKALRGLRVLRLRLALSNEGVRGVGGAQLRRAVKDEVKVVVLAILRPADRHPLTTAQQEKEEKQQATSGNKKQIKHQASRIEKRSRRVVGHGGDDKGGKDLVHQRKGEEREERERKGEGKAIRRDDGGPLT